MYKPASGDSNGTTASCCVGKKLKIANPFTIESAPSWADPTLTGWVSGSAVVITVDAFPRGVRASAAAVTEPAKSGRLSGGGRLPPPSSNMLKRAWLTDGVRLTKVNVVFQFPCAEMKGIEPCRLKPGMNAACCWIV